MRLYATPLVPGSGGSNPFAQLGFFAVGGRLSVAGGQKSSSLGSAACSISPASSSYLPDTPTA